MHSGVFLGLLGSDRVSSSVPVHCGVRFYSSLDSPGACYGDQPPQTGATAAAAVAKPATDQANNNRPGQHLKPRRRRFLLFYGPVVKRRQER